MCEDSLDGRLLELRSQNKEELKKTELRIKAIQYEIEDIRRISAKETTVSGTLSSTPHGAWV